MTVESSGDAVVYRSTAKTKAKALDAKSREQMLALAVKRAPDPSIFDEVDPFFFTVSASNRSVDSYFTTMDETSLVNYAADATDPGVQFQNSHSVKSVGFGRSLAGDVVGRGKNQEVLIDFYTVPGLRAEGTSSDEFILGARSGIYADVSIGFMPGEMRCNICGNDFLRKWDVEYGGPDYCGHWPGMKYQVGEGRSAKEVTCILNVIDGRLNEVSFVYDGATPGAGIVAIDMARMALAGGHLSEAERTGLENIFRVRIAPNERIHAVGELPTVTGRNVVEVEENVNETVTTDTTETVIELVDEEEAERNAADPMERLAEKYKGTGIRLGRDPHKAIEKLADTVLAQKAEIRKLDRDAKAGAEFREALMGDMKAAVVRAYAPDQAEAKQAWYERMLEHGSIQDIRDAISDLESRSPYAAGRQTAENVTIEKDGDGAEGANVTPIDKQRKKTPAKLTGM